MESNQGFTEGFTEVRQRRRHAVPISRRRQLYEWFVILLLLLSPLAGIFLFGAVRFWSFGPLMVLAFVAMAFFFLRPFFDSELRALQVPPGGVVWFGFILYAVCVWPSSVVPYEAKIELLKIMSYVGAYWVWTELAARHRRWKILCGILVFLLTLVAWYALIQYVRETNLVYMLERPGQYGMRASGTYICPNHFAALLGIGSCVSLAIVLTPTAGVPLRLLSAYGLALFLPCIFISQSRSGWLGVMAGLSMVVFLLALRKGGRNLLLTILLIPLSLVLIVGAAWFCSSMVRLRVKQAMQNEIRLVIWPDTVNMIKDKPVWGHGGGSFRWMYQSYDTHRRNQFTRYAHNEYLHLASEYGLVGLGLFTLFVLTGTGVFLYWMIKADRDKDAFLIAGFLGALTATLVHALFDFNLHLYANNHVLVLVAGVAASGLYASGYLKPRPLGRWAIPFYGSGVVLLIALAASTLHALTGYGLTLAGDYYYMCKPIPEFDTAEAYYQLSSEVDPSYWMSWLEHGNLLAERSFWARDEEYAQQAATQAFSKFEQALRLNPCDMNSKFGLAHLYEHVGNEEKCFELFREVIDFAPHNSLYLQQYAVMLRLKGHDRQALDVFREVRALDSTNEVVRFNIAELEAKLKR